MDIDPAESPDTGDGELIWGIRRSFIRHIATLPDADYAMDGGAYPADTSYFAFPAGPGPTAPHAAARFRGAVRIRGYGGMLDLDD
jgi:hypothetical protein